jgi:DNA-binding transcriptional LysR family regulator
LGETEHLTVLTSGSVSTTLLHSPAWLATGEIDLAVTMVLEHDVKPDDELLWPDELVWAHSASGDFAHLKRVPLVTFGRRCFFGAIADRLLTQADVPFDIVLENPSNYGVQMALASGAGIALINRRLLTDQHTEWEPPDTCRSGTRAPLCDSCRFIGTE